MASFFFYALSSDPRQTSLIRLLRTLLYYMLSESAALAKILFLSQWTKALSQPKVNSTYEILDDNVRTAYKLLANHHSSDVANEYCFCFFIDGLDEYQVTISVDHRELRTLGTLTPSDRVQFNHLVFILCFLESLPSEAKKCLWIELRDFYFLGDYEADQTFAEDGRFFERQPEPAHQRRIRAQKQLRAISKGLIEIIGLEPHGLHYAWDRLSFIHRSVRDYLKQIDVWTAMYDNQCNEVELISQLKLAGLKQYWWDATGVEMHKTSERMIEELNIQHQSEMIACLLHQRRMKNLDVPPYGFLHSLDSIPGLSVGNSIKRAGPYSTFHVSVWEGRVIDYEVSHLSRVQEKEYPPISSPSLVLVDIDEESDPGFQYSAHSEALISPLLSEVYLGRLEYPLWRVNGNCGTPLETDKLATLVYCAIGQILGRTAAISNVKDGRRTEEDTELLSSTAVLFLHELFQHQAIPTSLHVQMAFGAEHGFIRIAAEEQLLSIWQHFLCWWITAAAACGDFHGLQGGSHGCREPHCKYSHWSLRNSRASRLRLGSVLQAFICGGADLLQFVKIEWLHASLSLSEDWWHAYGLEIITNDGKVLRAKVNIKIMTHLGRQGKYSWQYPATANPKEWESIGGYPYLQPDQWWSHLYEHSPTGQRAGAKPKEDEDPSELFKFPETHMSIRDWIASSHQPDKEDLLRLIDEKLQDSAEVST
ncbi:uncharacterized protein PG986_002872 [Apiospora aurea]|uniref:Uncharacterized protein n=1 Tax=Apiospora aurea TaxID=335848 RepID=A0ABR1QQ22_9PEZI